jgi:hypothetical protein
MNDLKRFIHQLNRKLYESLDSYVSLDDQGKAQLADWYTADELRQVADALDEIDKKASELETLEAEKL